MPFIFIDHGSSVNRPYKPVGSRHVNAVTASAATLPSHPHDEHNPKKDFSGAVKSKSGENQQAISEYQQQSGQKDTQRKIRLAKEIMASPVMTLDIDKHTPQDAWHLMQKHHIRHIPVIRKQQLMAIVCERDLLLYVMNNSELPDHLNAIMVQQIHAASPDTDIHQLAHVMFDEHIGSLPIVDTKRKVIGIVTRSDILKVMSHYGPMEYWA